MKLFRLILSIMIITLVGSGCKSATDTLNNVLPTALPAGTSTEMPTQIPIKTQTELPDDKVDNPDIDNISVLKDEDFDINYNGIIINNRRPFSEIADDLGIVFDLENSNIFDADYYIELVAGSMHYHWFMAHYPSRENEEMTIEYVVDETLRESWLVSVDLHTVETHRGIKVGDSGDDFIKAYGDDTIKAHNNSDNPNIMWYQYIPHFGADEEYTDIGISAVVDFGTNTVTRINVNYARNETFDKLNISGFD